jgi:hypothetical protein
MPFRIHKLLKAPWLFNLLRGFWDWFMNMERHIHLTGILKKFKLLGNIAFFNTKMKPVAASSCY